MLQCLLQSASMGSEASVLLLTAAKPLPPCAAMSAHAGHPVLCNLQAGSRQCLVANSMPFAQFVNTAGTSALLPVCMSDEVRCPGMQATIQGALGSVPLLLIQSRLSGKADYAQYETWGSEILHATAFSILITAPVGLLVIGLLGKTCLKQVIIYTVSCCLPNQPQTQAQV